MLRYVAALAIMLCLSAALADGLSQSRDANLARVGTSCLLVRVASPNGSMGPTEQDIDRELGDKALLYSVPVKTNCTNELDTLPVVFVHILVYGPALTYQLRVLLPNGLAGYAEPDIWSDSGIAAHPGGIVAQDIKGQAAKAFDDFALAWKKEHQQ